MTPEQPQYAPPPGYAPPPQPAPAADAGLWRHSHIMTQIYFIMTQILNTSYQKSGAGADAGGGEAAPASDAGGDAGQCYNHFVTIQETQVSFSTVFVLPCYTKKFLHHTTIQVILNI